ncbi:MAG: glycoside hydrolase family 3 C-terminal domain-containing protein [Acetatifactor sp.]|nr:glycoside hydrolase family 3 C-terminal domain-containing protein [Acetatifactor sp.]
MTNQKFNLKEYARTAREAVAEGIVLIKNAGNILPLTGKHKVALFGRTQFNYYKSGTGSGGLVNTRYVTGIYEALASDADIELNTTVRKTYEDWVETHPFDVGQGWAQEPWFQEEMPLTEQLVIEAAKESDTAIIILGRTAGEDKDNKAEAGSYLLTAEELDMLGKVCGAFTRTVVLLNVGNIIDMKWVDEYNPSAVLYVWQGGQEGGNGVLDILKGTVNPSGRLSDTIPNNIEDCFSTAYHGDADSNTYAEDIYVGYRYFETFAKEKVKYPFGYGLSYTTFSHELTAVKGQENELTFEVKVTNTGAVAGKETVLLFVKAPQGKLGKAERTLCAFAKSDNLKSGETQTLTMVVPKYVLASYDDSGASGYKSCYVLEQGVYDFYLGGDVRKAQEIYSWTVTETTVVERLSEALAPVKTFKRLKPQQQVDGTFTVAWENAPVRTVSWKETRANHLPVELEFTGDKGYQLKDVRDGKVTVEQFVAQLTDEELMTIARGEGMSPAGVTPGIAGAFGGVSESLRNFGIPKGGCSDGPSGIRMDSGAKAFAMPNGTCLACSFNEALSEKLYEFEGMELRKNHIDTLLGPGMNIHRNPLNGRNFEYFSEDPLVTGKMAAAQLRGMHKYGVTGTIKHFACNNQEYMRSKVDTVASERALREIYLRGYEIAVKEAGAFLIMTSYNRINGIHAASNYDLLTTILRNEWGYNGAVMTDWWAQGNEENEAAQMGHTAVMVRAQNDLYMVMPDAGLPTAKDTSKEGLENGLVTRGEFQRTAINICNTLLRLPALSFMLDERTELDLELEAVQEEDADDMEIKHTVEESAEAGVFYLTDMDTSKGTSNLYQMASGGGAYRLTIECLVEGISELAQVPLTIFKERELLKTITLTGKDTSICTEVIEPIIATNTTFFLKFYFGQGGMKIKSCKLERTMSQDELMQKMREYRENGTAF